MNKSHSSPVGTVVKTLYLKLNKVKSINKVVELCKSRGYNDEIIQLFKSEDFIITKSVSVDLVEFASDMRYKDLLMWAEENDRKPMVAKHLLGILLQYPEDTCDKWIMALSSVKRGYVLQLYDILGVDRYLPQPKEKIIWSQDHQFGFFNE